MNSSQMFFLTALLVCSVQSKQSEYERSVPEYEPYVAEAKSNEEPTGTPSANRADRGTTATSDEKQEFVQTEPEEQKHNKKDKHYGNTSESKHYKSGKKPTGPDGSAEGIYNKEYKNKKSNGKGYNKKYNRHNSEYKTNYEELGADVPIDEQMPHESDYKRATKVTDPERGASERVERVERSAKLEPEPKMEEYIPEEKYHKQEKYRNYEHKSGKYGKNYKKSKKGSKRDKRSSGYFGSFWA